MPNVRAEIHTETLDEAAAAVSGFARSLPAPMREEGAALSKALRQATGTVRHAVDQIDAIENPSPTAPAPADPLLARRQVVSEAESGTRAALTEFDKRRQHIERQLSAQALPPPPTGSAAIAARQTIEAVVGDLEGEQASQALQAIARTADRDTVAELAGPWAAALARKHNVEPGELRAMAEWASSQGRFGAKYQPYAKALGQLSKVDEARKGLGALDSILASERS